MNAGPSFFTELKRRNVLRAAVLYIGAVWALAQGIAQLGPPLGAPDWIVKWFVIACTIGFPFWVAFAWFYEWTPQGIKRDGDVAPDAPSRHGAARKLDFAIIGVLVVAVVLLGSGYFIRRKPVVAAADAIPAKSIAVLPLVNMGGDPRQAYFSDGITEEILNALAQIPNLKVAARTSAFTFKSNESDVRKVGEVLGVATVLEGSVQQAGDEVRINVQLVDVRSGYQLWSEKYDRQLTNIFAIEDEISNAIAGKLRVQLTGGAGQALVAQKTMDPRAHDFYLQGLALLAMRGSSLRDAVAAFQQAVNIDPQYADAWGALAEAQALYPDYGLGAMQTAYASALAHARHALSLNPDLASAYVAQGMVYVDQWRWSEADQAFHRSLALAPGDVEARNQYAQFLMTAGQFKSALAEIERAQRVDPLSASISTVRAYLLMILHRYEAASVQTQRTLAMHPDFHDARANAVEIAVMLHQYADAKRQARLLAPIVGADPDVTASLVGGVADPALRAGALQSLETSHGAEGLRGDPMIYANYLALLGAYDRALVVLERFAIQRDSPNPEIIWDPAFDPIRDDPRFKAVLKQMGLPYAPTGTASP